MFIDHTIVSTKISCWEFSSSSNKFLVNLQLTHILHPKQKNFVLICWLCCQFEVLTCASTFSPLMIAIVDAGPPRRCSDYLLHYLFYWFQTPLKPEVLLASNPSLLQEPPSYHGENSWISQHPHLKICIHAAHCL